MSTFMPPQRDVQLSIYMDESPQDHRDFGWLFHMDGCKAYNELVWEFPHYECTCRREAWFLSHIVLGHLLGIPMLEG